MTISHNPAPIRTATRDKRTGLPVRWIMVRARSIQAETGRPLLSAYLRAQNEMAEQNGVRA